MTVKSGEVAFLKTTGEAVFVLEYATDPAYVDVRRPIAGQNGISHICERFRVIELESLDEQRERFIAEQQKAMAKFGPKTEQSPSQDAGFPIN